MSTFKLNESAYLERSITFKVDAVLYRTLMKLKEQHEVPISSIIRQMVEYSLANMDTEDNIDR